MQDGTGGTNDLRFSTSSGSDFAISSVFDLDIAANTKIGFRCITGGNGGGATVISATCARW